MMNDMFSNRLNDIRHRRCISIEKALKPYGLCFGLCNISIEINALRAKNDMFYVTCFMSKLRHILCRMFYVAYFIFFVTLVGTDNDKLIMC